MTLEGLLTRPILITAGLVATIITAVLLSTPTKPSEPPAARVAGAEDESTENEPLTVSLLARNQWRITHTGNGQVRLDDRPQTPASLWVMRTGGIGDDWEATFESLAHPGDYLVAGPDVPGTVAPTADAALTRQRGGWLFAAPTGTPPSDKAAPGHLLVRAPGDDGPSCIETITKTRSLTLRRKCGPGPNALFQIIPTNGNPPLHPRRE